MLKMKAARAPYLKLLTRAGETATRKRQTLEASATRRECDGKKIEQEIEQSRGRHEGNAREVEDFASKREKKVSNIRKKLAVEESFKGCKKTRKR